MSHFCSTMVSGQNLTRADVFWKINTVNWKSASYSDKHVFLTCQVLSTCPCSTPPSFYLSVSINSESSKPAGEYHKWPDNRQKAFICQRIWSITQLPLHPKIQQGSDSKSKFANLAPWHIDLEIFFSRSSDEFSVGLHLHSNLNIKLVKTPFPRINY